MNIIKNSLLNVILTTCFFMIPNKSNFSKIYYIPLMVSIIVKYVVGDFDKGYRYTVHDITFWVYNIILSYCVVMINKNVKLNTSK